MPATQSLNQQQIGEFVAIMWEVWNERNRVIFGQRAVGMKRGLAAKVVQFVRNYNEFNGHSQQTLATQDPLWKPPDTDTYKLNFDAGMVGVDCRGWGFVNHSVGFSTPELEEARACHFAMCTTMAYVYRKLVVEGD